MSLADCHQGVEARLTMAEPSREERSLATATWDARWEIADESFISLSTRPSVTHLCPECQWASQQHGSNSG